MNNYFKADILKNIAKQYGTPTYVYNKQKIIDNYFGYKSGFEENNSTNYLICYAVKANSNLSIIKLLADLGAGFDIVSLGELKRVLAAGGDPRKIVFSGVGKQDFEIEEAIKIGIACFNVESEPELVLINQIAKQQQSIAPISIRINPNINAKSHPYISTGLKDHKFGIAIENAEYIYKLAHNLKNISIIGIDCHIGSQLTDIAPLHETCQAINKLLDILEKNNIKITHINLGGGLGIDYEHNELNTIPTAGDWVKTILKTIKQEQSDKKILIEPGRSIIGNAGLLLSKVIYNKTDNIHHHNFTIIDAAMNDLLRPALYAATHKIVNVSSENNHDHNYTTSIVGPVCESSDVFIKKQKLFTNPDDLLAILDTGAYGFVMSSNYNSRPKAAEVMIDNNKYILIKPRETVEDLYRNEIIF